MILHSVEGKSIRYLPVIKRDNNDIINPDEDEKVSGSFLHDLHAIETPGRP